jgi:Uma2 family endonuclease
MVSNLAAEHPLLTADDLAVLPATEDRVELVEGRVERMSPAGGPHGRIAGKLLRLVGNHVAERGLGEVYAAETGFLLQRDPDTVRAPDAAFVLAARVAEVERSSGFLEGAPDLAIEVVSPNESGEAVESKVVDYLEAGVRQVWIAYPGRRTLRVVESRDRSRILGPDDVLDGGALLPGFSVRVGDLFPE